MCNINNIIPSLNKLAVVNSPKIVVSRPVNEVNLCNFKNALHSFDWEGLIESYFDCSTNILFDKFLTVFCRLFDMHILKKQCKVNPQFPNKNIRFDIIGTHLI